VVEDDWGSATDAGYAVAAHSNAAWFVIKEVVSRVIGDATFLGAAKTRKACFIYLQAVLINTGIVPLASLVGNQANAANTWARSEIFKASLGDESSPICRLHVFGRSINLPIRIHSFRRTCQCGRGRERSTHGVCWKALPCYSA
jgi:hypothetical protein